MSSIRMDIVLDGLQESERTMDATPGNPLTVPRSLNTASIDVAAMLLLLQAGISLVSLIGTIVFGFFFGNPLIFAGPIAVGALGILMPLLLMRGILRVRRKARTIVIVYQAVIMLAYAARLVIGQEFAIGLIPLLTGIALPMTILGIVLNRSCRRAFAKQPKKRRKAKLVAIDATSMTFEPAA
jgi:hypothetical protein